LGRWPWSNPPEVPRIGYAPSEYRTKPWPKEVRIEGWFPHSAREPQRFDLVEDVNDLRSRRERPSCWTTGKRPRLAVLASSTRAGLAAPASRTRTSPAARADWKRTPPLKRAGGDRRGSVLTLRSIEGHLRPRAPVTCPAPPCRAPPARPSGGEPQPPAVPKPPHRTHFRLRARCRRHPPPRRSPPALCRVEVEALLARRIPCPSPRQRLGRQAEVREDLLHRARLRDGRHRPHPGCAPRAT
jgi:hypothetical protein